MNINHSFQPMIYYKFKDIRDDIGYPLNCFDILKNSYLIFTDGRVYSLISNKFISQFKNHAGYSRIELKTESGKFRKYSVHRLVAETFIVNPLPGIFTDVDHMYGNKNDNYYMHLQWCSTKQNNYYASLNGQYEHGDNRYNSVYSDDFAKEICQQFQNGVPYMEVYKKYCKDKQDGSTIGSFIYKLYYRKTRRHITDQYIY